MVFPNSEFAPKKDEVVAALGLKTGDLVLVSAGKLTAARNSRCFGKDFWGSDSGTYG